MGQLSGGFVRSAIGKLGVVAAVVVAHHGVEAVQPLLCR